MTSPSVMRSLREDKGSELVELAAVVPILVIIIMGMIDFGFLMQRYDVVVNAAREAARLAVVGTHTNAEAETRALNYLALAGLTGSATAQATDTTMTVGGVNVNTKTVTVTYPSTFLFLPGTVNLRGVAVMRVEAGGS